MTPFVGVRVFWARFSFSICCISSIKRVEALQFIVVHSVIFPNMKSARQRLACLYSISVFSLYSKYHCFKGNMKVNAFSFTRCVSVYCLSRALEHDLNYPVHFIVYILINQYLVISSTLHKIHVSSIQCICHCKSYKQCALR